MSTTTTTTTDTSATGGRHPVNVGHLVMGIAFLGLVGIWALVQSDVVGSDDLRWLLPVPWVLAGLAGLLATTLSSRSKYETRVTGWVPAAGSDEETAVTDDTEVTDQTDDTGAAAAPVVTTTDPDDRG
ncbi:hypothetical protein [Nocardioides taihuensis]|uniref:Uncharacterized protein n=1 Tax=Nocardioides taihuensis TaxID=1835606 RepID=A0ABW0BFC1_9ACTN